MYTILDSHFIYMFVLKCNSHFHQNYTAIFSNFHLLLSHFKLSLFPFIFSTLLPFLCFFVLYFPTHIHFFSFLFCVYSIWGFKLGLFLSLCYISWTRWSNTNSVAIWGLYWMSSFLSLCLLLHHNGVVIFLHYYPAYNTCIDKNQD
jgi:hypothetical protein